MTSNSAAAALRCLLDVLVPGNADWPSASAALSNAEAWLATAGPNVAAALRARAPGVFAAAPDHRSATVAAWQAAEPDLFDQVLGAVYDAYYNSAPAHAAVVKLAEAGPVDSSPHFDPGLVARVVATGAGRRRL